MYYLINHHINQILQSIEANHVNEYVWLVQNVNSVAEDDYRRRYKSFWRPRFSEDFSNAYFHRLGEGLENPPQIGDLALQLHQEPTHANGRHSLQFSFCSKLCHMLNRETPIYDSMIKKFYFFSEPASRLSIQQRIDAYVQFHQFLTNEYDRVLHGGLLAPSIQSFRQAFLQHLNPADFTNIKVIDSLIWAFIRLLRRNAIMNNEIIY